MCVNVCERTHVCARVLVCACVGARAWKTAEEEGRGVGDIELWWHAICEQGYCFEIVGHEALQDGPSKKARYTVHQVRG